MDYAYPDADQDTTLELTVKSEWRSVLRGQLSYSNCGRGGWVGRMSKGAACIEPAFE